MHCYQRDPVKIFRQVPAMSASHDWHTGDDKNEYYDHITLWYLEAKRYRYQSIIFVCFYLYVAVVNFIDYTDMDKIMDMNNGKCY